jgi:hypothetical protein
MGEKSERAAALEVIRDYHAAQLTELVERVGHAIDRLRAGDGDAFDADAVIFQYGRAAKELWKFCNFGDAYNIAEAIRERGGFDWWTLGSPKDRRDT